MAGAKTILVVSHRLSALQFADQIITLTDGEVTEAGSPAALADNGGYFARTLQLQALEENDNGHG
jgi:ATP-binding cassette subfamily B protein